MQQSVEHGRLSAGEAAADGRCREASLEHPGRGPFAIVVGTRERLHGCEQPKHDAVTRSPREGGSYQE